MGEKEKVDKSMDSFINSDKKKLIVLIEENLNYNHYLRKVRYRGNDRGRTPDGSRNLHD